MARTGDIGVAAATAIGVGGMMGAGLYTLVGLAAHTAGVWIWASFLVGGVVSVFSVYSYAKLGARYPSRGGAAEFLIRCFGDSLVAGGLNIFQFLGWIIAMALYATGFSGYVLHLVRHEGSAWVGKAIGVGLVLFLMGANFIGAKAVGRAELVVVGIELVIIVGFVVAAALRATPSNFSEDTGGDGLLGMLIAAGLLYVTYEGFGVVTNSAGNMADPRKQLPRAMYLALGIVVTVYVVVAIMILMVLPLAIVEANAGHVLSEAGRAAAGQAGFIIIGVAALLATASGVNATLYGNANLAYTVAKTGEMPADFARGVWRSGTWGLVAAAALTCLFVVAFPLSSVGQMASMAFLIVYGAVSFGHLRVRRETGARAPLLIASVVLNAGLFALLLYYSVTEGSTAAATTLLLVLVASFAFEYAYRRATGRRLRVAAQ
ncbi:MAG TPA: APC family permease [Gordonia sp. (in: high G+C Gram-positive bacteria)]|uniref:APC family permease n=1 Tax=unclassified Gordonia (in: high G+C Gram-positive bacteria) TaxID=2657482 RepID=UPI0025C04D92|nr:MULTISPECIES: APC family permease [unclassified Gordonia (in: high G+C Gram-positive bacteria)]HNP56966.1 APC family permease [Gordonia sp. (in: high G+C Gram-positive bacteria)]HRC50410.1 APC family permease [Gordonia sp. (in: high G+C Gram-positive bacteria)]